MRGCHLFLWRKTADAAPGSRAEAGESKESIVCLSPMHAATAAAWG